MRGKSQMNFIGLFLKSKRRDYYAIQEEKRILVVRMTSIQQENEKLAKQISDTNSITSMLELELQKLTEKVRKTNSDEAAAVRLIGELKRKMKLRQMMI